MGPIVLAGYHFEWRSDEKESAYGAFCIDDSTQYKIRKVKRWR